MLSHGFDLDQLRAFQRVAERRSFRRAAEELHLSPPALSRRIDRLEELLGARLFERTSRSVELTRVGIEFLAQVRPALDQIDGAVLGLRGLTSGQRGVVTVAAVPSVTMRWLPRAIAAFAQELPEVRVRVIDESMAALALRVLGAEADFGIGFLGDDLPGLDAEPLREEPYVLALPRRHPLAGAVSISLDELAGLPLLALSRSSGNRQLLDRRFAERGLQLTHHHEAAHIWSLMAMVEGGLGCALVPAMALGPTHPTLVGVPVEGLAIGRTLAVLTASERRLSPVALRLRAHLLATADGA